MNKKIKPKKVDSVLLFGKVIGIYKKRNQQISKVLLQSSIIDLSLLGMEVNLGEDVLLETDVNLRHIKPKKPNLKRKAG